MLLITLPPNIDKSCSDYIEIDSLYKFIYAHTKAHKKALEIGFIISFISKYFMEEFYCQGFMIIRH